MLQYDIAFLKQDDAGMAQAAGRARERSVAETWIADKEASALAYSGSCARPGSLRAARSIRAYRLRSGSGRACGRQAVACERPCPGTE